MFFYRIIISFNVFLFLFNKINLSSDITTLKVQKYLPKFGSSRNLHYLCTAFEAQMAESVDALVSNTSGATRAGSTPALGTSRAEASSEVSAFSLTHHHSFFIQ